MHMVPRVMSTQHPDNASPPWWQADAVIQGDGEVEETFRSYSELGVDEAMWDAEGKDVDYHVVRKILSRYPDFFRERELGRDLFLTYRIPNASIEGPERKVVMETLESIPVSHDVASRFYERKVSPVFQVIIPFTTSSKDLISVLSYYRKVVVGKGRISLDSGMTVDEWIGDSEPKQIDIIPLIEDMPSVLKIREIVQEYVRFAYPKYMRVFIARSDPAMNYGFISATLLAKYAVHEIHRMSEGMGIPFYPILGAGTSVFRGRLVPGNEKRVMDEYRGYHTFTAQSAFRYDYGRDEARSAVESLMRNVVKEPMPVDAVQLRKVLEPYVARYQRMLESIAGLINVCARYIPPRRSRKLHIGLFGYSRNQGGIVLPRAITFVAALYSMGLPPEVFGISALQEMGDGDVDFIMSTYRGLREDLSAAAGLFNWDALDILGGSLKDEFRGMLLEDLRYLQDTLGIKPGPQDYATKKHALLSSLFLISMQSGHDDEARSAVLEMARARRTLG
ncbi:phosphoenolpyruvate carboxylase [Thermogymnomonas acidicola]|uniref:Phosphoenolpyruvate carboxylase n=2 Tax=Thermogymnomonas acidicola TaxID=399579 RepID=A0AA37BSK5_9ARCH|nr:phosphoenolpyruvate carboxylase [Thermogymnomonas acidicola]GGM78857.1 phosphoenolpyruvate carboxylase [Thermogymnomonas acidicola]